MMSHLRYGALSAYLKSWRLLSHIKRLQKSEWESKKDIERIQLQKLRTLVKHTYENVPFHHRRFKEIKLKPEDLKSLEDLKKLPLMRKEDLKKNFPITLTRNCNIKKLKKVSTSGSTGKPLESYIDNRANSHAWAAYYWFASWYGYYPGDRMVQILTASPWSHNSASSWNRFRWLKLTAYRMDEQTFRNFIVLIRKFKPKVLNAFTSPAYLLAQHLRKEGVTDISPTAVVTTGETLLGFQRRTIESAFNCRVFDFYGSSEIKSIAQECEEHSGLHINAIDRIVEVVRSGENVSPGEEGEIVITDLNNYAMPFIRYGTEDVGVPLDEACACGRSLPLLREIKGRVTDLLMSKDGKLLAGEFFALPAPYVFKSHEWIRQFQIIQPSREELIIKLVKSAEPKEEELNYLIDSIHKHLGDTDIKIEIVKSIPRANKRHFVISKVTQELMKEPFPKL